jgi:hypothetical protein
MVTPHSEQEVLVNVPIILLSKYVKISITN